MNVILGVNHQFLYPAAITDPRAHTESLRELVTLPQLNALDCWVWRTPECSREEIALLRDCGKQIHYNIGDRFGEDGCFPGSPDPAVRVRALEHLRRETDFALRVNAKKIVLGSGPDVPADRQGAKARFSEILLTLREELPADVTVALEPTDRDMDKFFLLGPAGETAEFIRSLRCAGMTNLGMLLDMSHIPLMRETMASAVSAAADTLVHIHLGNNIVKNSQNPMFGDKHVPFGVPDSEYDEADVGAFLQLLADCGYLRQAGCTVSFESRPQPGKTGAEGWADFRRIWQNSIAALRQEQ